jgi:hypothetical protein
LENQLDSLLQKIAEKHECRFRITPDQEKPHLHLWLISESGFMAHVWTFTSGHHPGKQSAKDEAVSIMKSHLEAGKNDRFSMAVQHAKERLASKGMV